MRDLSSQSPLMHSSDLQSRIGSHVAGTYRLLRVIGEGGMGAVFEAEHTYTRRRVAVKLIKPEFAASAEVNARFIQEARAATINHPNVCQVLDAGTDDDGPYLVLELLEGETLADVLDRRALGPREALSIMSETLGALAAAHETGIVHRDIKPENIFLLGGIDQLRGVKLLDFGISKILTEHREQGLTRIGTAVGTPDYMSPEQASGSRVDGRADLWSIGAVLYETLSLTAPFDGETYQQLLARILLHPHTPLTERLPDLHPGISALIDRALAKEVSQRWPSADAMRDEIDRLLQQLPMDEVRGPRDEPTSLFESERNDPTSIYPAASSVVAPLPGPPGLAPPVVSGLPMIPGIPGHPLAPPVPGLGADPFESTTTHMPARPSAPPPRVSLPPNPWGAEPDLPPMVTAQGPRPPRSSPRRPLWMVGAAAGVGVLLLGVLAAVAMGTSEPSPAATEPASGQPEAGATPAPSGLPTPTTPIDQPLVPVVQPLASADAAPVGVGSSPGSSSPPPAAPVAQPLVQQELTPPPASGDPPPSRPTGRNPDRVPDRAPDRVPDRVPDRNPDRAPLLVHHPGHARPPAPAAGPPLTVSEIMGILRPQMPRMVRCARDGGYHGNIVGSLNVDARGVVRSVRLDAPFSASGGAACVAQVLRGTRFPPGRPSDNVRIFASVQ